MKNILVIGKNSFLSKALNFINKGNFYSHKDLKKIKFENYDKLVLISMPPKYFVKKEKNFFFEKKILKKFFNKEIHYISSSKLYPMKIKCSEKIKKLNFKLPYTYNKYMIERLVKNHTRKFFIYRLSNVFLKNSYSQNTFFDLLYKNYDRYKKIDFNISLKSQKDFISINSLKLIFKLMLDNRVEYGLYNIGAEKGLDMRKVITFFLGKRAFQNAKIIKTGKKIISQTLDISKITNLLKINKKNIIKETIKELKK